MKGIFCKKWVMLLGLLPLSMQAQEAVNLDLTLDKAIELALADNPTMKVAEEEIELKKIADKEAWQNLLPTVTGTISSQYAITVAQVKMGGQTFKMGQDKTNTMAGVLTVSIPVYAPQVYKMMKMTKDDIKLAEEKARSSKLDLVNQVTKAYYGLMLAQDSHHVLQKSMQHAEENFEIVSQKYKVGTVSEFDKISAEVQMRNIKPSVISAENAVRLAKLRLKVLMGITADVNIVINDELENYENAMFSRQTWGDPNDLSRNTDLRQMDWNKKMLEHNLKIQKTAFLPTINLTGTYQQQSIANPNFRIWDYHFSGSSNIALGITIPIYRASNFTKLKTIRVQMQQLDERRINTERQLNMQAHTYLNNMQASTEQVNSNKEAMAQAQKARDISEKRYQVGGGTMLELNSSEVALTQSALTYCQSIYDYLIAKSDLDYVLGNTIE
ncbi:MAG: TolC family protein [Bacteroidales bacterium]|nr:TolC family protein [Candidatus Minthousia equi]